MREAANFCGLIQEIAAEPRRRRAGAGAGGALTDVADSLAARFGEWGATSRFARCRPDGSPAADASAARRSRGGRHRSLGRSRRRTERRGHQASGEPVQRRPCHGRPSRGRRDRDRLVESVLRPLAEAVTGKRLRARTRATATGGGADAGRARRAAVGAGAGRRPSAGAVARPSEQETLLMEATAALQDLALRSSPADERAMRASRRSGAPGPAATRRSAAPTTGPYLRDERRARARLARTGDPHDAADGALPLRRVGDQTGVRRGVRDASASPTRRTPSGSPTGATPTTACS